MIDVLCGYEIENDHEQRGAVMLRVVDESQIAPEFDVQMRLRLMRGEFVSPVVGWRMTFWRPRDYLED
jgi:hypothetical protein